MATEIPTEALEAAARALFTYDGLPDDEPWETLGHNDHDSYRKAAQACLPAAVAVLIELGWSPPTGPHVYLSTACRHAVEPGREELHDECKTNMIRPDGTHKKPAECKHCGAPCICTCHQEATDGTT